VVLPQPGRNGGVDVHYHAPAHPTLRAMTGADVHATDDEGSTALHQAALNGCEDVARLLLNRGMGIEQLSVPPLD
jgi:ankyrin repeat protein